MDRLRTASGKQFECDLFAPVPGMGLLYVRVVGVAISTAAAVFANPQETQTIWHNDLYISGYTKLDALIPEGNAIRVALRKE